MKTINFNSDLSEIQLYEAVRVLKTDFIDYTFETRIERFQLQVDFKLMKRVFDFDSIKKRDKEYNRILKFLK